MSWTPLVEVDSGNKSESEQLKELSDAEFRHAMLANMSAIDNQLRLLNARIEEAFETHIEESDV
ncbi:MAG: hypothetical protein KUG81_10345 [Gammaproteobacteria bacterium]|nr:hypothetical protein [Gammaproteobacteria bacterium]